MCQRIEEESLGLSHKLDEMIELLKSLPKETNEEDLAKYEYHEQQDLDFHNKGFKSQETPKESFRQQEHNDQVSEKDYYELDHKFEMAREGFKILRFMFGLDFKPHDKHIEIPMEVEPFDQAQLEDLGLNTCSHDLFLSSREVHSVDELEPQPLPTFLSLDANLGDKRGTNQLINPYSPDSFRMKLVDPLTIHTPPSPHVAYLHPKCILLLSPALDLKCRNTLFLCVK
ncbi:hypothetical protein Tco_0393482 [Tanacetum coccineum]